MLAGSSNTPACSTDQVAISGINKSGGTINTTATVVVEVTQQPHYSQ